MLCVGKGFWKGGWLDGEVGEAELLKELDTTW